MSVKDCRAPLSTVPCLKGGHQGGVGGGGGGEDVTS